MPRPLRDSVVVITGASSGIGRAAARAFAEQGATVVLAARREEPLKAAERECTGLGGRALVVPTDVSRNEEVEALARRAIETYGRIDVWVNNAAVLHFSRFEETPLEDIERVIRVNLFGCIYGSRAAIPRFRAQGEGVLINIASMVATSGQPFSSAYAASKWAIRGLSETLRMELLDAPGIHVCTVLPATIDTPLFQHAANYTGRAPRAIPPVYPPERVAAIIVGLVQQPQREVYAGTAARMVAFSSAIAPAMTERMMARMAARQEFQPKPAAPTAGNLFEPMASGDDARGGWMPQGGGSSGRPMLWTGLVLLLAVPLAWYAWSRRRLPGRAY